MAVIRENIMTNPTVRDKFLDGVVALDQERPGITTQQLADFLTRNSIPLQIRGTDQQISTYDLFVFWHVVAMIIQYSAGNAAHGGPIFLPWHRMYLIRLEQEIQRALNDTSFALPYWDWAADGELPTSQQWRTDLWSRDYLGESRGAVRSGKMGDMRVRLVLNARQGSLISVQPRAIERQAGLNRNVFTLPDKAEEMAVLNERTYDQSPWNTQAGGFRNLLEGWPSGPRLHNRVHVWIGGDMSPGSSPNDPAFFLNHCFVDRIWEHWMISNGREYEPKAGTGPAGHRINDQMVALLGAPLTAQDVLDPSQWYTYDSQITP